MTDAIVTFYSENDHPRIIPKFYGRSPNELSLLHVFVADNADPLLIDPQPRLSTWASTVRRGIRTRIRVPCAGSDSTDS
jgi:hypothetical protein